MTLFYKILRTILVTLVLLALVVPSVMYAVLSLPGVQRTIAERGKEELTALLGVPVDIERAEIKPFNKVTLHGVSVAVAPGDTALKVSRLGAGLRMGKLLMHGRLVFSYAEIIGLDARLWRDSASAPLNIQPIIDHLKPRDKNKPPTIYDLAIDNIVIRRSRLSYDVHSEPAPEPGKIDFKHISLSDIKADIRLPRVSNDSYVADLRRLAATERSGLVLNALSGRASVSDTLLIVDNMHIELPSSQLDFAPLRLRYEGWSDLTARITEHTFTVATLPGSQITPADLAPFFRPFLPFTSPIGIDLKAGGCVANLTMPRLTLTSTDDVASVEIEDATVSGLPAVDSLKIHLPKLHARADGHRLAELWRQTGSMPPKAVAMADTLGVVEAVVDATVGDGTTLLRLTLDSEPGVLDFDARYTGPFRHPTGPLKAYLTIDGIDVGAIAGVDGLGRVSGNVAFDGSLMGQNPPVGHAAAEIDQIQWKGYDINSITADIDLTRTDVSGTIVADDPMLGATIKGSCGIIPGEHHIDADIRIASLCPGMFGIIRQERFMGHVLSGRIEVDMHGREYDSLDGRLELTEMRFTDAARADALALDHLSLMSSGTTSPRFIMLHSDIVDARVEGEYRFRDIVPVARSILADVFPSLLSAHSTAVTPHRGVRGNGDDDDSLALDMTLDMQVRQNAATDSWLSFFKVPVRLLRPVTVKAMMSGANRLIEASVDAPNLLHKDKFIDNSYIGLTVDGESDDARMLVSTVYPTKKGDATISLVATGSHDSINVHAGWDIDRERMFRGAVELGAMFSRVPDAHIPGGMSTAIDVRPSRIVINDSVWRIRPSLIEIAPDRHVDVRDFEVSRHNQFIKINGSVSENPADYLCLELQSIDLDYVFETLDISAAMFGGIATGKFYASGLMSGEPRLETPRLDVSGMTYNHSPLGDAVIASYWDNATRGVVINADITGEKDAHSYVDGAIYPMADSLDFRFKAERLNVGFMRPFMEAFTSDVSGYASGEARLFGTFKFIDMTGDIFAENLRLKLDYTNTYYYATDSIHLTSGRISFADVKLRDAMGNSALLNGWVTHKCFKEPEFEFRVSNARNLLCYDITDKINPDWYGHILCNGSAFVKGVPGFVDINVNMSTAAGSVFTFVLSDTEAAGEYTFLTFHDRNELRGDLLLNLEDPQEAALRQLKERIRKEREQEQGSSVYRINLQVDVTPQAELVLVMDPEGGDNIKARGSGSLRMEYNSNDEDLRMFGTYSLTQGKYNFTLQDIIIKPFTIKPGSSISFHGSPYSAVLDINAVYSVNANLSDLDESFLQDKDLNRTNVPVHALLKVSGDMQQPDISFDLEFPTLTQDTYRKVRSIVSTDDMMNRQIIYLLALNRFYTPDYMASTTKGNELVSVASSTISSQLGSILGQLSDKWNIAPTFRSDRGDFSDMEVDLALSSYLLDNRLLFNGNFGYRDKALNNNSFIGDFDLEYLLNKSGNIRLKAYNRYNDQNYYVKSALTTQGVGIVFKRDFDDIFSWLKRLRRKHEQEKQAEQEKKAHEGARPQAGQ
ncbi:translocation/assembly module TamB domain-containing protein [Muribaculum intestinale]|uniref:translocation/assembly module TamB domain-containing protein n=1 Tax=Muribaculum intestinale TaxID=1796646 RepID=UPI00272956B3|nr:translocation/assembly module TamB domain-containing protein [Muribaculum intestinale]